MSLLLTPLPTLKFTLKNRLTLPPMATAKAKADGSMSEEILAYYDEKTQDQNLGLVIVEHSFISEEGRANKNQLSASKDHHVEGLRALSDLLRKNGAFSCLQINHAGMYARPSDASVVPFGVSSHPEKEVRVMTDEDIKKVISDFSAAARRAKEAGFDAVEIHSAHGYLLNQFYSPLTNKRTDAYGGSLENRRRIHREVLRAVREAVGESYPVFLRLGASDYQEGGTTLLDSVETAKILEAEGLDLLDVSGGFAGYINPHENTQGYFRDLTGELKKHIRIPVLLTGGITDLYAAEELLLKGESDLIGIGRAIYKDSGFLRKELERLRS